MTTRQAERIGDLYARVVALQRQRHGHQREIFGASWWSPVERLDGARRGFTLWVSEIGHYEVTRDKDGEPVEPSGARGLSTRASAVDRLDFELEHEG